MPATPPVTTTPPLYATAVREVLEALKHAIMKQAEAAAVDIGGAPHIGEPASVQDFHARGVYVLLPDDGEAKPLLAAKRQAVLTFQVVCTLTDYNGEAGALALADMAGVVVDAVGANPTLGLDGKVASAFPTEVIPERELADGVDLHKLTVVVRATILHGLKRST